MRQFFVTFLAVIAGLLVVKFLSPIKHLFTLAVSTVANKAHAAKSEKQPKQERSDV